MKRLLMGLAILVVAGAIYSVPALAGNNLNGNGAPSGPHYDLNIIGVPNPKTADLTGSNGHVIFVPLTGKCTINLAEGAFNVGDGNCTDDNTALFDLPAPDPTNSGTTTYSVFIRALGKPDGSAQMRSCFTDALAVTFCSTQMTLTRTQGKNAQLFGNVSQQLLYVYYCDTATGKTVRVPLFDKAGDSFFWEYLNTGLKLAQVRFYQVPTTVADAGAAC